VVAAGDGGMAAADGELPGYSGIVFPAPLSPGRAVEQ